jgi:hypothetical protein
MRALVELRFVGVQGHGARNAAVFGYGQIGVVRVAPTRVQMISAVTGSFACTRQLVYLVVYPRP